VFVSIIVSDDKEAGNYKVAYNTFRNIALAIDKASHNIPEVRAGPLS